MRPITITTQRLLLRPAQDGDSAAFGEAITENFGDPFFWFDAKSAEPEAVRKYLADRRADFLNGTDFPFFVFDHATGTLLGGAGLHPSDFSQGRFGISYWVRQSAAGHGIASEAANALLRFAFTKLRARSVGLGYIKGNEGSRRVMTKLGFVRYAQEVKPDGSVADIYRRTDLRGLPELAVDWEFL